MSEVEGVGVGLSLLMCWWWCMTFAVFFMVGLGLLRVGVWGGLPRRDFRRVQRVRFRRLRVVGSGDWWLLAKEEFGNDWVLEERISRRSCGSEVQIVRSFSGRWRSSAVKSSWRWA